MSAARKSIKSSVKVIDSFRGEFFFLSNFSPAHVTFEGSVYPSVEHAYQAAKTTDPEWRACIAAGSASEAKRIGCRVLAKPVDWESRKLDTMESLLRKKFTENADLKAKLLATGRTRLVEGNWWHDTFWGVCEGVGENHLGKLLMKVRRELVKGVSRQR